MAPGSMLIVQSLNCLTVRTLVQGMVTQGGDRGGQHCTLHAQHGQVQSRHSGRNPVIQKLQGHAQVAIGAFNLSIT